MIDDSSVNSQIVDAVSSIVTLTTGQAPAQALGMLDAVMLETLGMAMHNAVNRQQGAGMINAAAITAACAKMISALRFPHISSCEIKRLVGQAVEEGARMGHASR
ncbi:RebB family R body protein [Xanthomonas citri pv. citri]